MKLSRVSEGPVTRFPSLGQHTDEVLRELLGLGDAELSAASRAGSDLMPVDLRALAAPAHTALVTQEIQRGVVGDLSQLPELADAARLALPQIVRLVEAARAARVPVIHCTAERRADGLGANRNARIFQYMAKAPREAAAGLRGGAARARGRRRRSRTSCCRASTASRPSRAPSSTAILRNLGVHHHRRASASR